VSYTGVRFSPSPPKKLNDIFEDASSPGALLKHHSVFFIGIFISYVTNFLIQSIQNIMGCIFSKISKEEGPRGYFDDIGKKGCSSSGLVLFIFTQNFC
jgi:hypothetical protein